MRQIIDLKDNASADRIAGVIADGLGISANSFDIKPVDKYVIEAWLYMDEGKELPDEYLNRIAKDIQDGKLTEQDAKKIEEKINDGTALASAVKRLPFAGALKMYENSSKENRIALVKIMDNKFERLTKEKKDEYWPRIEKVLNETESEEK